MARQLAARAVGPGRSRPEGEFAFPPLLLCLRLTINAMELPVSNAP